MTVVALAAFFVLVLVALFGGHIAPYEPIYFVVEHASDPRPYEPGVVFPLGSDNLGRDLLSLVLAGARATLTIVLAAGSARVLAGALIAALGAWWRPARLLTDTIADLAAAVPATLVALLLVKVFVQGDAGVPTFIGALLVVGWAGPYRVIRAELQRLANAPFIEGGVALGASRWRLLWRHQFPHLAPVIAMNLAQQIVSALVLVAELGVLGVLVSTVRDINVEASLSRVRIGPPTSALVPDQPEWGAMLAGSRTVEALWTTRWLIFVPGAAFALSAVLVALVGYAVARRYTRHDVIADGRRFGLVACVVAGLAITSALLPERYAAAREWASAGEDNLTSEAAPAAAFAAAGLRTLTVAGEERIIERTGPATVSVGTSSISDIYPFPLAPVRGSIEAQALVTSETGGGTVEAPLVFAARGIVPAEFLDRHEPYKPRQGTTGALPPAMGALLKDYPDDYAGIDVSHKVVLLVRFMGVDAGDGVVVHGPSVGDSISAAIKRGAAAVIFVDPLLGEYSGSDGSVPARGPVNPYLQLERLWPARSTGGVPVVVLAPSSARSLVGPLGLDLGPFLGYDPRWTAWQASSARDLGVTARVSVPMREQTVSAPSIVGEVKGIPASEGRIVVWAERSYQQGDVDPRRASVMAALAELAASRRSPFVFVDFDPHAETRVIRQALGNERVALVLMLGDLQGSSLRFDTASGDLIPALDLYARSAGARATPTRFTLPIEGVPQPIPGVRTVVINSEGVGDVRADAVALIGYLAGRLALGDPEVPR